MLHGVLNIKKIIINKVTYLFCIYRYGHVFIIGSLFPPKTEGLSSLTDLIEVN